MLENRSFHDDQEGKKLFFQHQSRFAEYGVPAENVIAPVSLDFQSIISRGLQVGGQNERNILRYVNGAFSMNGGDQIVAIVDIDQQFGFCEVRLENGGA